MKDIEKVVYLCSRIVQGVKENDKDSTRSHLEDLSNFLIEKDMLAE